MKTVRWIFLVVALLSTLVVAGCGRDDSEDNGSTGAATSGSAQTAAAADDTAPPELIEAAKKEGAVSWYNSQSPDKAQEVIDGFQERYGIEVEVLRLSGSQLAQRYTADLQAGNQPDAIAVADPAFFEGTSKDLMKLTPENVPAVADYPPDAIRYGDTTALVGITPWNVIVNTDVTEEVPQTWDDVLKPEFKDQIVFPDPRIIPTVLGMTKMWYDELGPDFLEKFGAQNPTIVDSGVPGVQSVAAGEKKILVSTEPAVSQPLIDEGAPLENVLITPTIGTNMMMGISAEPPHPNAAKLLMNYLLSPEGQEAANSPDRVSPVKGTPNTAELPEGYTEVDLKEADGQKEQLFELLGLN